MDFERLLGTFNATSEHASHLAQSHRVSDANRAQVEATLAQATALAMVAAAINNSGGNGKIAKALKVLEMRKESALDRQQEWEDEREHQAAMGEQQVIDLADEIIQLLS